MTDPSKKGRHLTRDDRVRIETYLDQHMSLRSIAFELGKSPSTISREIKNHTRIIVPKSCDCLYRHNCTIKNLCGSGCPRSCRSCQKAKKACPHYAQALCDDRENRQPALCNGCGTRAYCKFERRFYVADEAEEAYQDTLVNMRNGFDLTSAEFNKINDLVSPLIKQGQSLYHITKTLGNDLPVSESTLRRLVGHGELDVRNIDLRWTVKRKRRHKRQSAPKMSSRQKTGHLWTDYLAFQEEHQLPVVEMDCVEGKKSDNAVLLTLHFVPFSMQIALILDNQTTECVVAALDKVESAIRKELFKQTIPLILTDNGHEFSDFEGIERSIEGGKRTRVFYCEPNRSDQKGACENNHRLIRFVIPKGTSLEPFNELDISLMMNHINSYRRPSLFGKCPYDAARAVLPEEFFDLLGL